jgi:putative spermidine/putrescine transport system substrate-binding protein
MQPIETGKIKLWDKVVPIFTKGEYPDGRKVSDQGTLPFEVQYVAGADSSEFHSGPTDHLSMIPTIYNADTLGLRPDQIGRPIEKASRFRAFSSYSGA